MILVYGFLFRWQPACRKPTLYVSQKISFQYKNPAPKTGSRIVTNDIRNEKTGTIYVLWELFQSLSIHLLK